jgi:hypothetical protein
MMRVPRFMSQLAGVYEGSTQIGQEKVGAVCECYTAPFAAGTLGSRGTTHEGSTSIPALSHVQDQSSVVHCMLESMDPPRLHNYILGALFQNSASFDTNQLFPAINVNSMELCASLSAVTLPNIMYLNPPKRGTFFLTASSATHSLSLRPPAIKERSESGGTKPSAYSRPI